MAARLIWVPKNAECYAHSKSEDKIEKKCTDNKLILKTENEQHSYGPDKFIYGHF